MPADDEKAREIARRSKPNWRVVEPERGLEDADAAPPHSDAQLPDDATLRRKYLGDTRDLEPEEAERGIDDTAMVEMEPPNAEKTAGRKRVIVSRGETIGEQG
jgi:hypothetical protein